MLVKKHSELTSDAAFYRRRLAHFGDLQNNFCGDIGMPVRRDRIELGMLGIRTATRARLSDRFPMMSAA
jgi:hypothetical protein